MGIRSESAGKSAWRWPGDVVEVVFLIGAEYLDVQVRLAWLAIVQHTYQGIRIGFCESRFKELDSS